jgi:hypothetical protein
MRRTDTCAVISRKPWAPRRPSVPGATGLWSSVLCICVRVWGSTVVRTRSRSLRLDSFWAG